MIDQRQDKQIQKAVFDGENYSDAATKGQKEMYLQLKKELEGLERPEIVSFEILPSTFKRVENRMAEKKRFRQALRRGIFLIMIIFLMIILGLGLINVDIIYRILYPTLLLLVPTLTIVLIGHYLDKNLLSKKKTPRYLYRG